MQGEPDQMCSIIPLTEGSCLHFTFVTSHPGKPRNALRDKSQQVWVVLAGETRSLLDRGLCVYLRFLRWSCLLPVDENLSSHIFLKILEYDAFGAFFKFVNLLKVLKTEKKVFLCFHTTCK